MRNWTPGDVAWPVLVTLAMVLLAVFGGGCNATGLEQTTAIVDAGDDSSGPDMTHCDRITTDGRCCRHYIGGYCYNELPDLASQPDLFEVPPYPVGHSCDPWKGCAECSIGCCTTVQPYLCR